MTEEPFLLKDLFDQDSVGTLADALTAADDRFPRSEFLDAVFDHRWHDLELKQRMRHIATVLRDLLPGGYRDQLDGLLHAVPHTPAGFPAMVYSDFVGAFGTGDWEASMPALRRFTTLVSAEFAIRPFIISDQDRTLRQMLEWAGDSDPAVRRLATEGCRPRLPWGRRIPALVDNPQPIVPILDRLHNDPDEAVRRSVANNLNDIAKDHPDLVVTTLERWAATPTEHTRRLTRHALRTLLKQGHPGALAQCGFELEPAVTIDALAIEPGTIAIGGTAHLSFTLISTGDRNQSVMADYAVHYVKADGTTAPKVFKLRTLELTPGSRVGLRRKLDFRQRSTRTHRPGTHRLEIIVNGASLGIVDFLLTD